MTVYCYYYLSANYLIPIRKGWIRKTKNHQQEPEENERSKNNEQRATAIGLEKQTKSHTHFQNVEMGNTLFAHAFNGGFIMDTKEKAKKAPSKKELLKDIIALDDRFESGSLSRTNVTNLVILKSLLTS